MDKHCRICHNTSCSNHGKNISFLGDGWKCNYIPVPTNADRIRAMSDEELALWICGVYDIEEENGKFINGIIIPGYAPHDIEEWLQQPAGEEDKHEPN